MKSHNPQFLAIVQTAKTRIKEITITQAKAVLSNENPPYLIDVREQDEWHSGHLPNAIHLSKGVIERDIEKVIPDQNANILLYCGGGFRSALAADNLQKMGYSNVISIDGGFSGWVNSGYEVVKDPSLR